MAPLPSQSHLKFSGDSRALRVELITVGPGTAFFSWFGHTALVITDTTTGDQRLFDYGVFMGKPEATSEILAGTPRVHLAVRDPAVTITRWTAAGRTIRSQQLGLSASQRFELLNRLLTDFGAQREGYVYRLRTDNCTTRIRDLLDDVTGGALRRAGTGATNESVRTTGRNLLTVSWPIAAFELLLNNDVDRPGTEFDAAMYPAPLSRLVATAVVPDPNGSPNPLVVMTSGDTTATDPAVPVARYPTAWGLAGTLWAGLLLALAKAARHGRRFARAGWGLVMAVTGLIFGILGLTLAVGWAFTDHPFLIHNENLLLTNPVLLVATPLGLAHAAGSLRAARGLLLVFGGSAILVLIVLLLKTVALLNQDNWRLLSLVLPVLFGGTWAAHFVVNGSTRGDLPSQWSLQTRLRPTPSR